MMLLAVGVFLVLDGFISMVEFKEQPWYRQLVRLVRLVIGVVLIESSL